jgi:ketosteroid isomerase-like protein
MDAESRRIIEWDCQQVLTRFINCLDARDYEGLSACFAPDGVWFRPGGPVRGPSAIHAAVAGRPDPASLTIRHVISNIVVDPLDEDHAEAVTYLTVYRYEGAPSEKGLAPLLGPYMVGVSANKLVRVGTKWRISEKRTQRIFERSASRGPS